MDSAGASQRRVLFIPDFAGEETTRECYNRDLGYLEDWLNREGLTIDDVAAADWRRFIRFRAWGYKAERRALSAARCWLRQNLNGRSSDHPLFSVPWPEGQRKPQRRLKPAQRDALLAACDDTHDPLRNRALILLLWDTGVRKAELARAQWQHLDLDDRTLYLQTKAESGRGRQWELKRFSPATARALADWRQERTADPRIFALTREGISSLLKRLSAKVGFPVSAHDFRRGIGCYMAEQLIPDRIVMKQLGIKTHSVYQRYTELASLKALDALWGAE